MFKNWLVQKSSKINIQEYLGKYVAGTWEFISYNTRKEKLSNFLNYQIDIIGLSGNCPYTKILDQYNMGYFNLLAKETNYLGSTINTPKRFKKFLLSLENKVTIDEYTVERVDVTPHDKAKVYFIKGKYISLNLFYDGGLIHFNLKNLPTNYQLDREDYIADLATQLSELYKEEERLCGELHNNL